MRFKITNNSPLCLSTKSYSLDQFPLLISSEKSKVLAVSFSLNFSCLSCSVCSLRCFLNLWILLQYSSLRFTSSVSLTISQMLELPSMHCKNVALDWLMNLSYPSTLSTVSACSSCVCMVLANLTLMIYINNYLISPMLKSFDFFRKIRTDQELTSATGGLFTIISLIAAGFLILLSLQDFYQEKYFTFLSVQNDDSQFLPMQIDILFYHLPCEALAIQFKDELEYIQHGLENKLAMYHVKDGELHGEQYKRSSDKNVEKDNLKRHLVENARCRATGTIPLPKTPGTILIGASGQSNLIWEVESHLISQTRLNYRLDSLSFGMGNSTFDFPIAHKSKNIQNYIKELQGDINTRKIIQDFETKGQKLNFFSHLKIIPVVMQAQGSKKSVQNYRYSIRSGWTFNNEPTQKVMFMTEIQPINIVYKKHDPAFYDLARQILAIVGGTVATIGIFNSVSHFFFNIK